MSYCAYVKTLDKDNLHRIYHDTEYGFPLREDNELFGRLILEINQAGLSWTTILKKKDSIREAYANFDIQKVANYSQQNIEQLLKNAGIIRNKLKINAAIYNAKQIIHIQKEHGSFTHWLDIQQPKTKDEWVKLFKKTFKFTGGEITNEFLLSTRYLPGAHESTCPINKKIDAVVSTQ